MPISIFLLALVAVALVGFFLIRRSSSAPLGNPTDANAWEIGPAWDGRTGSKGMPPHPSAHPDGLVIELPSTQQQGHANYVTLRGSLAGKREMRLRFRVEGGPIMAKDYPAQVGMLTPYFQRRGDDWRARSMTTEFHRWYANNHAIALRPGEYEVTVPLTPEHWVSTIGRPDPALNEASFLAQWDARMPIAFQEALADTERVGFVLGGGDGAGHGVYGPGRIVVTAFVVE